jgi:hypothetical protein
MLRDEQPYIHELVEIDTGFNTHSVEHENQVLGRNIPCGTGREGATAKTSYRAVKHPHALLQASQDVCKGLSTRIVEMAGDMVDADLVTHGSDHVSRLASCADTDRVPQGDFVTTKFDQLGRYRHNRLHRNRALERATQNA